MKSISIWHAAYIAGLTDGEGHLDVDRIPKKHSSQCDVYAARFEVANTYVQVLSWMRDLTGMGVVEPQTIAKAGNKQGWSWRLKTVEIELLLPTIMPYMIIKLSQAELVMEFLSLPTFKGHRVPDEIDIQRHLIWEDITELNRRGV